MGPTDNFSLVTGSKGRIDRRNRSTGVTCARDEDEEIRKERQIRQRNLTVANWVFAQTTHVIGLKSNLAWGNLREGGGSSKVQVSSKSVKWFPRCGVEICPFPLLWPLAYATACTCTRPTVQTVIMPSVNVSVHCIRHADALIALYAHIT